MAGKGVRDHPAPTNPLSILNAAKLYEVSEQVMIRGGAGMKWATNPHRSDRLHIAAHRGDTAVE